jgi:hypothetical protein
MAAASIAIDIYSTIKQRIKEFSTLTGMHPKIVMSENTFNELAHTLQELEYNGAGHYLREFMQVEGCKVIISSRIEDGTFQLLE